MYVTLAFRGWPLFNSVTQLLAIEHVHAHNIIHRDVKPENIFIDTDGHVVLGDFGIACQFDSDASPHACFTRGRVGTPAFSSPEVLLEKDYGFEVDLWAFGVILCEMLNGRVSASVSLLHIHLLNVLYRRRLPSTVFRQMTLHG